MKGAPMIMQGRQVTRFLRLFDSLLAFCVRDLEVPDLVAPDKDPLEDEDLRKVLRAVWGEEGDLSVIDRYVEANPDKVTRSTTTSITCPPTC